MSEWHEHFQLSIALGYTSLKTTGGLTELFLKLATTVK